MSIEKKLGQDLNTYANAAESMQLHIYQKGKGYSFSVTRAPEGKIGRFFQKVLEKLTHIGQKKLNQATTEEVLLRAAEIGAAGSKDRVKNGDQRIDPIAKALIKKTNTPVEILARVADKYEQQESENITKTRSDVNQTLLRHELEKAVDSIPNMTDMQGRSFAEIAPKTANLVLENPDSVGKGAREFQRSLGGITILEEETAGQMKQLSHKDRDMGHILHILATKTGADPATLDLEKLQSASSQDAHEWGDSQAKDTPFSKLVACFSQNVWLQQPSEGIAPKYGELNTTHPFAIAKTKAQSHGPNAKRMEYEVTFLKNGNIRFQVSFPYNATLKPKPGELQGQQLATFDFVATWDFDSSLSCIGYRSSVKNLGLLARPN